MSFLAALEREVDEKIAASRRFFSAMVLTSDDWLQIRKRRRPKAAKKRRTVNKWRNEIARTSRSIRKRY
jgi:hypothetical protein